MQVDLVSYLLEAQICRLVYLGITCNPLNSFLAVDIQGVALRAAYVAAPVKMVCSRWSVLKAVRLSVQAVHFEATSIIINNGKRRTRESGFKDLEGMLGCLTCRSAAPQTLCTLHDLYSVFVQHDKGGLSTLLTTHASLNDLEACSESLKIQLTSTFGQFASMFRIIQK